MNQIILNLYIDISQLDQCYYIYETDPNAINPSDIIADSLVMQAFLFNSAAYCLMTSINNMQHCKNNCINTDFDNHNNHALLRYAFREVCVNSVTYFEKIKTFCIYYFNISNSINKKQNNEWLVVLKQFAKLNPTLYEKFISLCFTLIDSESYKFIKKIRNDETHNQSPLFLKKIHFDEDCSLGLRYTDEGYVIENEKISNFLDVIIILLAKILDTLQELISTNSPYIIAEFIEKNKNDMKSINKIEKRYVQTRDFIHKYTEK